jgi:hypothetical protein
MNKQEAADKKELLEKRIEGGEASQEILEFDAQKAKEELESFYKQNISALTAEEQAALDAGDIENVTKLHGTAQELTRITEKKIEQETKEKAIEHLPNYLADTEEAKRVDIITASDRIQKRFEEKISPSMKEAVATVCSNVFNKNKYPYALIGSNCYIPHTEYSKKIPDDLDVVFGIKDLGIDLKDIAEEQGPDGRTTTKVMRYSDGAYAELAKMQEQGLIKNLGVEEQRRFGKEKNGCIKVHCFIKTSDGWKEMEAFAQNMHDEIANEGKKKNGIINLGADQERLEVVDVNGVKVNIGDEKLAEELYLKNIVNEFGLYNLNGWEKKGSINAKALQRIFNVINLDSQKFEDSIDQLIEKIGTIESPTEEAKDAQASLAGLWNKFKSLKEKGPGLVNHLMEKNDLKINAANDREQKILATEKAVDIITAETREDMKNMSDRYTRLEKNCREILDAAESSPEKYREAIEAIDQEVENLSAVGMKYKKYLHKVNSADKNDFCVYAAMPRLRNQFIRPLITRLMENRRDLKDKLKK